MQALGLHYAVIANMGNISHREYRSMWSFCLYVIIAFPVPVAGIDMVILYWMGGGGCSRLVACRGAFLTVLSRLEVSVSQWIETDQGSCEDSLSGVLYEEMGLAAQNIVLCNWVKRRRASIGVSVWGLDLFESAGRGCVMGSGTLN